MFNVEDPRVLEYVYGDETNVIGKLWGIMGEVVKELDDISRSEVSKARYCVFCGTEYPYHKDNCKVGKMITKLTKV